eukprot:6184532-Pleurochrysis_carterae.AAC.1
MASLPSMVIKSGSTCVFQWQKSICCAATVEARNGVTCGTTLHWIDLLGFGTDMEGPDARCGNNHALR